MRTQSKKSREKKIISLLIAYLILVFFYGIVIKFTIAVPILFIIKTYLPEIILIIISGGCLFYGRTLKTKRFFAIGGLYFIGILVVSIVYTGVSYDSFYCIRDLFLPIYMSMAVASWKFERESLDRFLKIFERICFVYLIIGAFLGAIEVLNGWRWTSVFYTGYEFYNVDPYSKVRITQASGLLRAPGLTGAPVTFAYYGLVCCILIMANKKRHWLWKVLAAICEMAILWETSNKTAIVIMAAVLFLYIFRRVNKTIRYMMLGGLGLFAVGYILTHSSADVFYSTFDRFNYWKKIGDSTNLLEIVFPYNSLSYNPNAEGVLSFWDNSYFMFLFSTGIFGTIWIYIHCYKMCKANIKMFPEHSFLFEVTFIFLLLASAFNNITNGRAYFTLFLVINSVFYGRATCEKEKMKEDMEGVRYDYNTQRT